ncbi:uncharacterized protein LOC105642953 isoform X2 [Jatropha curcas]|uniref:uncharacterized protein LOC105642953 isoform X2 n=1 Tax=Jatropha curcas TaxID=180498 RepID=UPI0005FBDAF0|nr:uncharacterized protein LOC105642953 isoform X2 [Jatropha curcas]
MRIRKNANLSSLISSHASGPESLQTHVCQLNQSPWDVIPFSQETYPSSLHQFEEEDSFNGNGSLGNSIGAVESSVASLMEDAEDKAAMTVDNMIIDDNYEMERIAEKKRVFDDYQEMKIGSEFKLKKGGKLHCCNKTDGKGWHCKNETKEGHSICDHHFILLKSYNNVSNSCISLPTSPSTKKQEKVNLAGGRRGRGKAAKKGSSSTSNPYEFYYYSGFGPLWGKRRGGDKFGEGNKNESKESEINGMDIGPRNTTPSPTTCSSIEHHEEFDFVDEDDDDEEDSENGDSGAKKRMRKPVKARSLKSLM